MEDIFNKMFTVLSEERRHYDALRHIVCLSFKSVLEEKKKNNISNRHLAFLTKKLNEVYNSNDLVALKTSLTQSCLP